MKKTIGCIALSFLLFTPFSHAQQPMVLGVSLPLSGDLHEYGQSVMNGFTLATEEDSELSKQIQLIYDDNKYIAKDAVTSYLRLAENSSISGIYIWGEVPTFAIQHLVDKQKVPVLSMSVDGSPFHGQQYLRRVIADASTFMAPICKALLKEGVDTIAVVQTEDPFMFAMGRALSSCPNIKVLSQETVGLDEKDFKSLATKIKAREPSAVACLLNSTQAGLFARSLKVLGVKSRIVGTDVFDSESEIDLSQGGLQGALFPVIAIPESFEKAYEKRFHNTNQIPYAYNSYATAKMLGTLLKAKKTVTRESLISFLDTTLGNKLNSESLIETTIELKVVSGTTAKRTTL